jgi:hypothetical protein
MSVSGFFLLSNNSSISTLFSGLLLSSSIGFNLHIGKLCFKISPSALVSL